MTEDREPKDLLRDDHKTMIVTSLYDVALDPSRYEALLDLWEERIAPLRGREGPAGDEFGDAILEGHVLRADQVLDREPQGGMRDPLAHLMTSLLPTAAFVLNRHAMLVHVNTAAKAVFTIDAGRKVGDLPFDDLQCDALSTAALEIVAGRTTQKYVRCLMRDGERLVVFRLTPMDPGEYGAGLVLAVSTELAWPDGLSDTIREAFQLTSAEIDIVRALVEGLSVNEIAEARGRSVETVRSQLRSILAKTQTKTQAELIRITLNLMDVIGVSPKPTGLKVAGNGRNSLKPLPFHTLWRPDGRGMDYVVLGDPAGRPILFLPGNYGLIRWPATAESLLEARGLRVIVPIKPGYGNSTRVPRKANLPKLVAEDILALMEHLNVRRAPLVAQGLDVYFGYTFDRLYPGRLTAIVTGGPAFPVLSKAQFDRMGKWHRFIRANARYAPRLIPFLVKAGFSLSRRIGKRGFLQAVYGNSAGDVATFEDPEIFEALATGSEVAVSESHSAHEAFTNEAIITNRDWRELVHACKLPIFAFVGHEDPSLPVETIEELKTEFPEIVFLEDHEAGELILFRNWRAMLDRVSAFVERQI